MYTVVINYLMGLEGLKMALKPETVEGLKKLYTEQKDVVEYMAKFGNAFERAQARVIKSVL